MITHLILIDGGDVTLTHIDENLEAGQVIYTANA